MLSTLKPKETKTDKKFAIPPLYEHRVECQAFRENAQIFSQNRVFEAYLEVGEKVIPKLYPSNL